MSNTCYLTARGQVIDPRGILSSWYPPQIATGIVRVNDATPSCRISLRTEQLTAEMPYQVRDVILSH